MSEHVQQLRQMMIDVRFGAASDYATNCGRLNIAINRYVRLKGALIRGELTDALWDLSGRPPVRNPDYQQIRSETSGIFAPSDRDPHTPGLTLYAILSGNRELHALRDDGLKVEYLRTCLEAMPGHCGRLRLCNFKKLHERELRWRRHSISRDIVVYRDQARMFEHLRPMFDIDVENHVAYVTDRFVE